MGLDPKIRAGWPKSHNVKLTIGVLPNVDCVKSVDNPFPSKEDPDPPVGALDLERPFGRQLLRERFQAVASHGGLALHAVRR